MKQGYIPKQERKKILLLADDIRSHTGVATMSREIVLGTCHRFNWYTVGSALQHPQAGQLFDISQDVSKETGVVDPDVKILPYNGYGDSGLIRHLLKNEKPDAIFIFTDPRYWTWLFEIEREIRNKIPIIWYTIWDCPPAPHYNNLYYQSVDTLLCISQQTKLLVEEVLGEEAKNKIIRYVPHGINSKMFYPLDKEEQNFKDFKKTLFDGKEIEFTVFFNSRNIHRKHPSDLIQAYAMFCESIPREQAQKCALILHTAAVDQNGTDLNAVRDLFCDSEYCNVYFSEQPLSPSQMNMLYNVADLTVLPSSNEGWGLSITESMMAGTMFSATVTGGMQDQMKFMDRDGNLFTPSPELPSLHRGNPDHPFYGEWCLPIFPTNISLVGSPNTPYIYDDRVSAEGIRDQIQKAFLMSKEERQRRGREGEKWALNPKSGMSSTQMCENVIQGIDDTLSTFQPRPMFELLKVEDPKKPEKKVKMYGYGKK